MKRLLISAALAAVTIGGYAQINSPEPEGYVARAVAMYDDANYRGCLDQLTALDDMLKPGALLPGASLTPSQRETCAYYRALATVHTDPVEAARLLRAFLQGYPASPVRADAQLALGDCYYGANYREALRIYREIDTHTLSHSKTQDLAYRHAYCLLKTDDLTGAKTLFATLTTSAEYGNAANFYCGYIEFVERNYGKAQQYFSQVDKSRAPGDMTDYFMCQIWYIQNDYDNALSTARVLIRRGKDVTHSQSSDSEYLAEAYRIAGMSAYRKGMPDQAADYLQKYAGLVQSPLPSAAYVLGINDYQLGDYAQAIDYLKIATEQPGEAGQNAYLYLGQAYMHQDDYTAAAMALNRALNMDYDEQARETAYYNYAVATLSGGKVPFASTIGILTDFLAKYPDSSYAPDVQKYIVTSYITDNNYEAALRSIDAMSNPSAATLAAKQQVLYTLGNRAIGAGQYAQAQDYLLQARKLAKYNRDVNHEVDLLLGEAYYRNGQTDDAVTELQRYVRESSESDANLPIARYDLGYALLAKNRPVDARQQFELVIKSPGSLGASAIADTYNRLGDALYLTHDYRGASEAYDQAYAKHPSAGDYALYQKALMEGYQRHYNDKIATIGQLQREFKGSALIPSAMLELTEAYIQLGNNAKAIETYRTLVDTYPQTVQARQGYLQMALVKLNSGDRQGAKADYREVIRRYPTSDEARQAVDQMKRITAADGTLSEFMAYLDGIETAPKIEQSEADLLTFENAEQLYLEAGKTAKLAEYTDSYPSGSQRARALAYLLESAQSKADDTEAYKWATMIVEQYPSSTYVTTALTAKAEIEERQGKGNLAMRTWQQLAQSASSPETLLKARLGVMRTACEGGDYDVALNAAQAVQASSGVGSAELAEAYYTVGRAKSRKQQRIEAYKAWEKGAELIDELYGIQSALMLAEHYLADKDYAKAEKWAKSVANSESAHTYWIARGFIALSDIYRAQGDTYRARQYVEALRDNYTGDETDIQEMIEQRLR